jgi:anti-sigma-K factor RskA
MSEQDGMSCAEFGDVAAELALGVLTGRERAEALAHLDQCEACREHVRQLTITGEEMLSLLPSAEPPAGFETRVMDRLGLSASAPPRPASPGKQRTPRRWVPASSGARRILAAAAAVIAIAVAALGGWGLHGTTAPPASQPALSSATLLAADHDNVGQVFLYNGQPRWMYMSVDLESGDSTVICQLVSADGHVTTVGSFRLADGYGAWGSPAWTGSGAPVGARLISSDGKVLATATFPRATA